MFYLRGLCGGKCVDYHGSESGQVSSHSSFSQIKVDFYSQEREVVNLSYMGCICGNHGASTYCHAVIHIPYSPTDSIPSLS